jgi:hypothetical protein
MLEMEDASAGWDVEDVACAVDDMKATDCSRSFVQREDSGEGEVDKNSRSELMAVSTMQTAQTPVGVSWKRYGIIGSRPGLGFSAKKIAL